MAKYNFNNIEDMVALAKTVQSSVYFGMEFSYHDDEELIPYMSFWDYVSCSLEEGYNAVSISDNNEVEFIKE